MVICIVSNIDVHISKAVCSRFFDIRGVIFISHTDIINGDKCVDKEWLRQSEDDLHFCARACVLGLNLSFSRHITRVEA